MKLITDLKELEGKTILNATSVDVDESIAVVFNDDTYIVIGIESYGESHDTVLLDSVSDTIKREARVISDAEYDNIMQEKRQEALDRQETFERKQLEELKTKYPEV